MNRLVKPVAWLLLAGFVSLPQAADEAALQAEAKSIISQFAGQLKPALQRAMQSGGPVSAVTVCADKAPQIAAELSAETGWRVRRVSLKPRNVASAVPDEWAEVHLRDFDERYAGGEQARTLVASGYVNHEYRFLKAQPVEPLCLVCHGESIAPAVQAELDRYYPDDMATGYRADQLRGAFYLTLPTTDAARH